MRTFCKKFWAIAGVVFFCGTAYAQPHELLARPAPQSVLEVVAFAIAPHSDTQSPALQPAAQDHVYTARLRSLLGSQKRVQAATLFTAADTIGFPDAVASQIAEIFADQVDFHRDLHGGYRCSFVYEVIYEEGRIARAGRILAAEIELEDRRFSAYYFVDEMGRGGYYSDNGTSVTRTFRRAPLEFTRITSQFSLARLHPILGVWRAHRGVDYAAPAGTKVLAAADGVLDFAGERGAYGKLVVLRHPGGYFTYYAHLQEHERGLSVGQKVTKGDVIGQVGMTGLATAPHLHYELRVSGPAGERISVPPAGNGAIAPALGEPAFVPEWRQVSSSAFFDSVRSYRAKLRVAQETHFVMLD